METNLAPVTKLVSGTTNLESSEKETRETALLDIYHIGNILLKESVETLNNILLKERKETLNNIRPKLNNIWLKESEETPQLEALRLRSETIGNIWLDNRRRNEEPRNIFLTYCEEETLNILLINSPWCEEALNILPKSIPLYKRNPNIFFLGNYPKIINMSPRPIRYELYDYLDYERDPIGLEAYRSFCEYYDTVKPVQEESSLAWESGKENMQITGRVCLHPAVQKGMIGTSRLRLSNTILHLATTRKLTQISIVESDVKNCPHSVHLSIPSSSLTSTLQSKNGSQLLWTKLLEISLSMDKTIAKISLNMDKTLANFHHSKLYNHKQAMNNDGVMEEGLQSICNTMTIASVLIATVSFTAGIYASSGVHQEGMTSRKSSLGRTTAYMVFLVCNNVAFFSSLGITAALFSGISFSRKSMIKLLAVMQKIMWVSLSFMVAAYIAAAFMI